MELTTLEPVMEAIAVPGAISGTAIIADLIDRIGDKLSRDCNLRCIDVYGGHSYRVTVELQLHGVYQTEVTTGV